MNYTVKAGIRHGKISVPASKSYAHRQLICAALSGEESVVICDGLSKDIIATAGCLEAMGAKIDFQDNKIRIKPIHYNMQKIVLDCNESGSTLRFLLPIAGALGMEATFKMADGLAARPIDELLNVMREHNVIITKEGNYISLKGRMTAGEYSIMGNVSSQYISGLLMALPLLEGDSRLSITGKLESQDYIKITEDSLSKASVKYDKKDNEYIITGNQQYKADKCSEVEQDWSNAAFFLCMGALSKEGITIEKMPLNSSQGDKAIMDILKSMGADIQYKGNSIIVKRNVLKGITVDASTIPDLVPTIAALASLCEGTTIINNALRLRIKESDRLMSTSKMLLSLGADVTELEDGLIINGKAKLHGGTIDSYNDHRIAMAAAVAACGCEQNVVIINSGCIAKSYPKFWEHLEGLEIENE